VNINFDDLVKSPKSLFFVIPAKAGIQYFHRVTKNLDPVFQRGDDFLRDRQLSLNKKSTNSVSNSEMSIFCNIKEIKKLGGGVVYLLAAIKAT
jgi:hypothetical protein